MKNLFLARNTELLSGSGNVEEDYTNWLNCPKFPPEQIIPPEPAEEFEIVDKVEEETDIFEEETLDDLDKLSFGDISTPQEDALEYIAGYVIRKLNLVEYECKQQSFTWVDQLSKGYLKKPTPDFLSKIIELESIFKKENGEEISHSPKLRQSLLKKSACVDLPDKIKDFFFKCRIYFRIRKLNKDLKIEKGKNRMMNQSKNSKICL